MRRTFWRIWLLVSAVLILLSSISSISHAVAEGNYGDDRSYAAKRWHFWRVIAGREVATAATPAEILASDLRARLGPINRAATSLPEAIIRFEGDSNAYGGLDRDLRYNPFEGGACLCGHLTADARSKLLLVKQDRVEEIIAADQPTRPGEAFFGWGWTLLVLIGGPVIAGLLYLRPHLSRWRREHDVEAQFPEITQRIESLEKIRASLPPVETLNIQLIDKRIVELERMRSRLSVKGGTDVQGALAEADLTINAYREIFPELQEERRAIRGR